MLKIPYGISNFESLITEGYLYIDKTQYVRQIEDMGKFLFLVRPRRFGKSLFVSMLESYYDVARADEFGRVFGGLNVGREPTELRNRYLVLRLDFSAVETSQGTDALRSSFQKKIAIALDYFSQHYRAQLGDHSIDTDLPPEALIQEVVSAARQKSQRICVLIDEYDNFANDLLARGEDQTYRGMVHASGFVRTFYKALKEGTASAIDRIFVTGVSPVMLDDLTSGFNIARNITLERAMHDAFGFTEAELRTILRQQKLDQNEQQLVDELCVLYNGYRFHRSGQALFNPDMVLHYLMALQSTGERPDFIIDQNVKTDYGRLRNLALRNPANAQMIDGISADESIQEELIPQFSFDRMYDTEYFVSLLFYLGLLTMDEVRHGLLTLRIPNYAIKTLYWEYFRKLLAERHHVPIRTGDVAKAAQRLAWDGEVEPLAQYVAENVLKKLSHRDFIHFDEKHIKVILFSLLGLTDFYLCHSEMEVEHGFVDLFLSRNARFPDLPFEWLIELKYLKETERAKLPVVKQQALDQIERYSQSRELRSRFQGEAIRHTALIFVGKGNVEIVAPTPC